MDSKFIMCILLIFLTSLFCGCIFPYPIFSSGSYLSDTQLAQYNDLYENENLQYSSSIEIKVLNLDWFETVNDFFEKYKKTRIIDVETKKEYYVMRTGGYNHADVEVVDQANLSIFKSIYGGEFSWARRSVWVEIGGCFVAGSINGMPHGYSTITQNGENGHSCIHFLNSKTHGTKRIDEAHQEAINDAYNRAKELVNYLSKSNY